MSLGMGFPWRRTTEFHSRRLSTSKSKYTESVPPCCLNHFAASLIISIEETRRGVESRALLGGYAITSCSANEYA